MVLQKEVLDNYMCDNEDDKSISKENIFLSAQDFYKSLEYFHEQAEPIQKLFIDYHTNHHNGNSSCEKRFFALKIKNGVVKKFTSTITKNINNIHYFKEIIELWDKYEKENNKVVRSIYKLEFENKIFLFKIFSFTDRENEKTFVYAGYYFDNNVKNRLFVAFLRNQQLEHHLNMSIKKLMEYNNESSTDNIKEED